MKRCLNCMNEYGEEYEVCPKCGYVENTPPKEMYYLTPGMLLNNRFIVGTVVGVGGFGIVYKAWDTVLNHIVAIKEYYPISMVQRVPGNSEVIVFGNKNQAYHKELERFLLEARNLAKFSQHPNVVNVYNFFEENNTAYIVMEYLEGMDFKHFIKQHGGTVSIETAVQVITSVLEALAVIHKENIIHRDISPDNIFICKDGKIKLMDFGAAYFPKEEKEKRDIVLKPGFAPPEQYQNNSKQGIFTDIYAVGAVLYRAVTGFIPEESTNRGIEDNLKQPKEINSEVSEALNNTIMRALALLPELRFQTDEEFRDALIKGADARVRNVKEELKHRKKRRIIGISIAACLVAFCGMISINYYQNRKKEVELDPALLNMWVCAPDDSTEQYAQMYENALAEYRENYPQVTLRVEVIPETEYQNRYEIAATEGSLPDIFQYTEGMDLEAAASTKRVLQYVDSSQYLGLDEINHVYEGYKVLPVTFELSAVYLNSILYTQEDNYQQAYQDMLSTGNLMTDEEELGKFLAGESKFVVADTSIYQQVQLSLPGQYEMKLASDTEPKAFYETMFCINNQSEVVNYNASVWVLVYLLSENAQASLGMEHIIGLPMQETIYQQFVLCNPEYEVFDEIKDKLEFMK